MTHVLERSHAFSQASTIHRTIKLQRSRHSIRTGSRLSQLCNVCPSFYTKTCRLLAANRHFCVLIGLRTQLTCCETCVMWYARLQRRQSFRHKWATAYPYAVLRRLFVLFANYLHCSPTIRTTRQLCAFFVDYSPTIPLNVLLLSVANEICIGII